MQVSNRGFMKDKIGNIKNEALMEYYKMLIGRVYKLMPMKENNTNKDNWKKEKDKLVLELHSGEKLFNDSGLYVEIIYKLQCLDELDHVPFDRNSPFKKCIVETIDVIKQLLKKFEENYGKDNHN